MRRLLAATASLCLLLTAAPPALADPADPQPQASVGVLDGPATAWIVADLDSGEILAGRNENNRSGPASTIKTLLAQVVVDEVPLDATVVADAADTRVECNCAGVAPGQTYTARQLLDGLLLVSGNDAANTLAHLLGGMDATVAKMNAKAAALGATSTRVGSPSGIDGPGIDMWSTPRDMAVIFRGAMGYPVLTEIMAQHSATFPAKGGDRVLVNQDEMLARYPGFLAGKTGYTDLARKTFVGAASRDGRRLVIAMMYGLVREGGPSYWDQATSLLDWGFAQGQGPGIGTL
ncbi:D-alanyl-D-alanine carboxypeptidase [Mycolicibacterium insubricum]|mgnify:FL=1|jgi:D-alanyl-D-alanine carboxypeptidase (penicillin-binding protein 5/6)|uniref:D-alanyl-D-alanine carboxypeptidase n=1 Tax=Mycolicibacterium insubricum TaxID=444597 RepID=A0A1X0DJ31_9MYCO|nr:serine hydrolase [Mycolicibacterium insubricum]MCB9439963.1 D-alanyl-D-alanine carboxypeptidase [Mycolicibacterium sp.]ORA72169.1 D-alanyl-D-alanine carboxypeptidase [Mycolicibacterium insubricum]BBZ66611.1 D-alanyl-D-alanine carboxypeptidase [Mycolicibacterium insubricum]